MISNNSQLSLLELNYILKEGIQGIFQGGVWVIAEISDLSVNQNGHCYLELIEKAEDTANIKARAKATIWSFTFRILRPYFESVTRTRFSSGIKVLIFVSVEFHEIYGLSLNVKDIDPSYTVGDLTRQKQQIISRLTEEGVIDMNKGLELPVICRNIAVISSETAAGYGDFTKQLKHNSRGFKFKITLFQAYMQGEGTERSVVEALEKIFANHQQFDLVVIIRGGGSQAELNYFNNYNIAFHISQFPIPVFTGIGHDRDQTIVDLVAHTSLKTPTAVAEHILILMEGAANYQELLENKVISLASEYISDQKVNLSHLSNDLRNVNKWAFANLQNTFNLLENNFNQRLRNMLPQRIAALDRLQHHFENRLKYNLLMHRHNLFRLEQVIPLVTKAYIKKEKNRLHVTDTLISAYNPTNILKRGYSITYLNGKALRSPMELKDGDIIDTRLAEGCINSTVNKT